MEERWWGVRAILEWLAAAAAVMLVLWLVSAPVQRAIGSRLQAAVAEAPSADDTPPGVPGSAMMVPVLLLKDGREVRHGDLRTELDTVLPPKLAEGPPVASSARFGERQARAYRINGAQLFVVCERLEPNGPMRVSGIYLP